MRCRLAQVVVFATSCLLFGRPHVNAQSSDSTAFCPNSPASDDKQPSSGPAISIAEVIFSGPLRMPISEQEQIADSVKQKTNGTSLGGVTDEGLERVRAGWQDRGYFKVRVTGDTTTLTSSPVSQRIALSVRVHEGSQYNLRDITFKNNKAISSVGILRGLFPIANGDIFSRKQIATGLENLRKAYGILGYINFTSIPNTVLDDDKRLVSLDIDIDEGKQFFLTRIDILGVDEPSQQEILKDSPIGQIYNQRLFELFLDKHATIFKFLHDDPAHIDRQLDERAGTVAITLDARPCPVD